MKDTALWVIAGGILFIGLLIAMVLGTCAYSMYYAAWRKANEPPWGWEADREMRRQR